MKRAAYLSIFLIVAVMLFRPAQAAPVGKITFVLGRADITVGSQPAKPAYKGDDVNVGDILRTKSKSKAEVTFVDGSILRLAQNSRIKINEYMVKKEQTRSTLQLFRGKVQSIVIGLAGLFGRAKQNRYEVRTPTAVCGVRGTDFFTWYIDGESGAAFNKGNGYIFPSSAPKQVRNVNTGQAAMVKTADTPPVIAPATDVEIQQHITDTAPTEETTSGDDTPQGPITVGDGGPPPTIPTVGDDTIFNIYANPFTFTEFSGQAGLGFFENGLGLFAGGITEQTGEGLVVLSGLVSGYGGGAQAGPIGGTTTDSGGGAGAFNGYLSGVAGSYNALFSSIYIDSNKEVGYLYGALSSGAGPVEGQILSAAGTAFRSDSLGSASYIVPVPGTVQTLPQALAAAMQDFGYPVPTIAGIDLDNGTIDPGSTSAQKGIELNPYPDAPGRRLNVWNFTSNDGSFVNTGGKTSADFIYGQIGVNSYALGDINVQDNLTGLVSVSGRLTYIDETHMGDIFLWNRGRYLDGSFTNAGAGNTTADPLAYSGYWGSGGGAGEVLTTIGSIYADDQGSFDMVANDDGLLGGNTAPWKAAAAPMMALGEYSAAATGRNLWNTSIFGQDPFFYVESGRGLARVPVFFGATGGWWEMPETSAYGTMTGAGVAIYMDPDPASATHGQSGWLLSSDISGSIIANLPTPMWQATGNWNRTFKQTVNSPLDYDVYFGSFNDVSLAGDFNGSGAIHGRNYDAGGTMFWYDTGSEAALASLPWGAYDLKLGDGNTYMDRSGDVWSAVAGGMADFDYVPSSEGGDYGYWIARAEGTWTADGRIGGTLGQLGNRAKGAYISPYTIGTLGGNFQGISGYETWIGQSLGRFEGAPNTFFSRLYAEVSHAEVYPYDSVFEYGSNDYVVEIYEAELYGNLGGASSLWAGADIPVSVIGTIYDYGESSVWATDIYSSNYISGGQTTYDGGAYKGFAGGIKLDGLLSGDMVALYIDPNQNAGYLFMDLDGSVYPDISMFEMAGAANRQQMETGFAVLPEELWENLYTDYFSLYGYGGFSTGGGNIYSGYYDSTGGGDINTIEFVDAGWGAWSGKQYGGFDRDQNSNDWIMYLEDAYAYYGETWVLAGDLGGRVDAQWSGGRIKGDVTGAWIDIEQAVTGVLGGELAGSFNAVNATWESVAAGGFIETGRFLDMVQNNRAALQALNIPYAEVGRADLTGSVVIPGYGTQQVNMYDTTFFAYSTGAKPRIWASGEVTGTNSTGFSYTVPISGASGNTDVSADFYMQQYNNSPGGSWNATVDGIGTVGGVAGTTFKGGAAGTVGAGTDSRDFSYDFSGTAAGVVNAPNPVSPPPSP